MLQPLTHDFRPSHPALTVVISIRRATRTPQAPASACVHPGKEEEERH